MEQLELSKQNDRIQANIEALVAEVEAVVYDLSLLDTNLDTVDFTPYTVFFVRIGSEFAFIKDSLYISSKQLPGGGAGSVLDGA